MTTPILPPATIGMLGGGQLGRYAVMAAATMGYRTIVLDPSADAPAGVAADEHLVADYDDSASLDHLAQHCAVITTEFENPPASALDYLAERTLVAPNPAAVGVAQDRIAEKRFFERLGIDTGPWAPLEADDDLTRLAELEVPLVLKTARLGYDGKGQRRVTSVDEVDEAWRELGSERCVAEEILAFDDEISAIVARTAEGATAAYPIARNLHVDGILDATEVPAAVPAAHAEAAVDAALGIADALDYVGVLAVEFFVVDELLLANEMAPRPHNSGHWTLNGAVTSQFEQQIRAVCGLPLGDTSMTTDSIAMVNLLGELWERQPPRWPDVLDGSSALHLYRKSTPRPGRKMGHLNVWGRRVTAAEARQRRTRLHRS